MNWREVSIGELGRIVTGKTPPTGNREFYDGEYPFVTPTDLDWQSYIVRSTHSSVTELARNRNKNQFIPANSTVFTCIGNTIGKCGLSAVDCLTNQQINSVVPADEHDPKFVYYLLNYYRPQIRSLGLGNGAAQPIINKATFSGVKISVPATRDDEQRIAAILSAYDDLIENNRRRIALLEEAARQLYKEWFVRFRFPGHEHVKIIDGLPEGWEWLPLGDVLTLQRGFDLPVSERNEGSVPVYGSTGIVGFHDAAKVDAPMLITGRSGSLGQVCFVPVPCWPLNTALWVREFKRVNAWFAYFLLSEMGLEKYNGGASVPTLDRKVAHAASVILPSKHLLKTFDETAQQNFELIHNLAKQNEQLVKARDLILPKLMSGAIAV